MLWGTGNRPCPPSGATRVRFTCALILLAACADSASVEDIRASFDPPNAYQGWWNLTLECSAFARPLGLRVEMDRVTWFVTSEFPGQPNVLGQWNELREITIRNDARYNGPVIQHEILHDLLTGDGRHESAAWDDCALPRGID
jgi:hypothetical protein